MGARPRIPSIWTPAQRGVLIGCVLVLSVVLLIRLYFNRAYISDPQPARPSRFDELADKLDPNLATWEELAVLPQIGKKRAKEIVAYREDFRSRGNETVAFSRAEDLLKIKGVGVAMLATIRPYLTFPSSQPATRGVS